jgi:hypothetical protein
VTAVVCTCEVPTASVFGDTAHVHEAGRKARCLAYITDARAPIEQAKGILRTCHATTADRAFEMLRDHSQHKRPQTQRRGCRRRREPPPAPSGATHIVRAD